MGKFTFESIRQRVLAMFLLVVLVIILLVITVTGSLTHSEVNNLMEDNAFFLVQSYVQAIGTWKKERFQELQQLANTPRLKTLDWDYIEAYLQKQIGDLPPCFLVYLLADASGNYNTTTQREAGNIAHLDFFPQLLAGETRISEPLICPSSGEKALVVTTPVWNEEETEVIGVLGLTLGLCALQESLAKLNIGNPGTSVFIVDKNGYFIIHPDPELIMTERIQDHYPGWNPFSDEERHSFSLQADNIAYRAFSREIPAFEGWHAIVQIPMEHINLPVRNLLFYLAAVALFCIVLVIRVGTWFAATIADPIIELNEIFRLGSEGDLTVRAEVATTDEIGETRASFNRMMDTIGTMTYYDPLTELPNRQFFLDHLKNVLEADRAIILALISIQGFSELKTLLGPAVTDDVLIEAAIALRSLGYDETVAARVGDGEFGLIIPSSVSGILRIIDELERFVAMPLSIVGSDLKITLREGVTISEKGDIDPEAFYRQAQSALYEAEHADDGKLKLYNPSAHLAIMDRVRFQTEIRNALAREQFVVFYQPIVDLRSRQVIGKEALIRWRHPVRGLLLPIDFLEVAEQGGFIEMIGEYMLTRVCEQHSLWTRQQRDLGWVAVNISPNHFRSRGFPGLVRNVLKSCENEKCILQIEITEDAMLSPTKTVLNNLQELREMGVRLAIDDFGTAYSTLEYLVRYPVETLKIDQTFIDPMDRDMRSRGLVRSIIAMGRNLSMSVVAEGVERREQVRLLCEMGCSTAQGYYFSYPVPWEKYPEIAAELDKRLKIDEYMAAETFK